MRKSLHPSGVPEFVDILARANLPRPFLAPFQGAEFLFIRFRGCRFAQPPATFWQPFRLRGKTTRQPERRTHAKHKPTPRAGAVATGIPGVASRQAARPARLEYRGPSRFNLASMRHTGQWVVVDANRSLTGCLRAMRDEELFQPSGKGGARSVRRRKVVHRTPRSGPYM